MKIKICGIKSENDLKTAIEAGADAVGFLVGQLHASKDFILPSTASRLAASLPPFISPVIVTHLIDSESIMGIAKKTGIGTVQLHGGSPANEVKKLRDMLPVNSKIILAVHLSIGICEPDPSEFIPFIDAILLDSYNRTSGQIGGTGKTHDWAKSREIVESSQLPVILAGGLNPDNVSDAIMKVKPFGIDANSGLKNNDGSRSLELCRNYVINARKAALAAFL
jgi:phosphoribosylanthranilate isomerase